ncbi:hypothetical protein RhiirA5_369034 [Rhizophagus irregularis]|uniref:Uncharacterized protein n=1 Tax=Rhizophagus irregularis TaxID=588596 RepID=A0A2N0QED3_9GLOM|nr:hypothetical protein RhiirA5_369034 [Rhizophagus irregularis]
MDEETNIYRFWIERNKTYCNEHDLRNKYSQSKKLAIYDHFIEKYIVFESLNAFWEMLDNTPKEYCCFSEVVFKDMPQAPVIEIGFSSETRYPGTQIVGILRTILDTVLELFRTDYQDIVRVPSSLDDMTVMDEIVQNDGTWSYFFHIHTPAFYFPSHSYVEFLERLYTSLPFNIRPMVSRPSSHPYQLVGIFGSFSLSIHDPKRISPYSQFLGTRTSVERYNLFVTRFSVTQDPASSVPLKLKCLGSAFQETSEEEWEAPQIRSHECITLPDDVSTSPFIQQNNTATNSEAILGEAYKADSSDNVSMSSVHQLSHTMEDKKCENAPVTCVDHIAIGDDLVRGEIPEGYCEALCNTTECIIGTQGDGFGNSNETKPVNTDMSSIHSSHSASVIFISASSIDRIVSHTDPQYLATYAVLNYIVLLFAIYRKIRNNGGSEVVKRRIIQCHTKCSLGTPSESTSYPLGRCPKFIGPRKPAANYSRGTPFRIKKPVDKNKSRLYQKCSGKAHELRNCFYQSTGQGRGQVIQKQGDYVICGHRALPEYITHNNKNTERKIGYPHQGELNNNA